MPYELFLNQSEDCDIKHRDGTLSVDER